MPLIKPVVQIGSSRGLIIPASWLKEIEQRTEAEVTELLIEIDGEITIKPRGSSKH